MEKKMPGYVKNCVTHHNACDCREYFQQEKIEKLEKMVTEAGITIQSLEISEESAQQFAKASKEREERLEAENKMLEECRKFYADPENWTRRETIFWESIDRADCKDYPHIARNVRLTGGHMARETAKKIEALRKKE